MLGSMVVLGNKFMKRQIGQYVMKEVDFEILLSTIHLTYIFNDIIGNLAKSGNWHSNLKQDHEQIEQIVNNTSALKNKLSIDVSLYQNAGANITQQLAYTLAQANEYLNHFNGAIGDKIVFNVTVGTNYFFEIAKLRAFRTLWKSLLKEYDLSNINILNNRCIFSASNINKI